MTRTTGAVAVLLAATISMVACHRYQATGASEPAPSAAPSASCGDAALSDARGRQTTGGGPPMSAEELAGALGRDDAIGPLAGRLRANAARIPGQAVQLLVGPEDNGDPGAPRLLGSLRELGVGSLVELNPSRAEQRSDLVALAVEAELESRRRVVARIDAMLDDGGPLPRNVGADAKRSHAPMRVCDIAYLSMRRMVKLVDGAADEAALADAFAQMTVSERATRIRRARASKPWQRALTGKMLEGD